MALRVAGLRGGSAYLTGGSRRQWSVPKDLSHQLAGLKAALPNPQALTSQEEAGQAGRGGSLCQDRDLSLCLRSVKAHVMNSVCVTPVAYVKTCGLLASDLFV